MEPALAKIAEPLQIGSVTLKNRAFLAPMAGVTDAPFRRLTARLGAGLVVSEMVASEALLQGDRNMARRASSDGVNPCAIQLAGRDARWMGEGARLAQDLGAAILDINMGCPAKRVTSGLSGSALMRDLDHALGLIKAVVAAARVPVTLKMRTGWDEASRNAPELARRAQDAGVAMITVHGRTRCQFYSGRADWAFLANVKSAVSIPLIANGDLQSASDAGSMLRQSGACGVMAGRGALGQPWLLGNLARQATGDAPFRPSRNTLFELIAGHYEDMLCHYGLDLGLRCARKHLAAYIERAAPGRADRTAWRKRICRSEQPHQVLGLLRDFCTGMPERELAA